MNVNTEIGLAAAINTTGKQRMLAHRMLLLISVLRSTNRPEFRDSLRAAYDEFISKHREITKLLSQIKNANGINDAALSNFFQWLERLDLDKPELLDDDELNARTEQVTGELVQTLNQVIKVFEAKLAELGERSSAQQEQSDVFIQQVAADLQDISNKIKLIAMNARIEASRFGEEGAAFAVIANEVKQLSELSQNKVKDILKHLVA